MSSETGSFRVESRATCPAFHLFIRYISRYRSGNLFCRHLAGAKYVAIRQIRHRNLRKSGSYRVPAAAPGGASRSISARSSAVISMSAARTFSSRCRRDFAPGIGTTKTPARIPRTIGHAMASWARVAFFLRAMTSSAAQRRDFSQRSHSETAAIAHACHRRQADRPWGLR
jgi:hypothetical protein